MIGAGCRTGLRLELTKESISPVQSILCIIYTGHCLLPYLLMSSGCLKSDISLSSILNMFSVCDNAN
jgi:hypothetical protein